MGISFFFLNLQIFVCSGLSLFVGLIGILNFLMGWLLSDKNQLGCSSLDLAY